MCGSHAIWLTKYPNSPLQMALTAPVSLGYLAVSGVLLNLWPFLKPWFQEPNQTGNPFELFSSAQDTVFLSPVGYI